MKWMNLAQGAGVAAMTILLMAAFPIKRDPDRVLAGCSATGKDGSCIDVNSANGGCTLRSSGGCIMSATPCLTTTACAKCRCNEFGIPGGPAGKKDCYCW